MGWIASVESRSGYDDSYRVRYQGVFGYSWTDIHATDELAAFTQITKQLRIAEVNMRFFICSVAAVALSLIWSITLYSVSVNSQYTSNMQACLKAGKNYVSENKGYSCR